MVAGSSNDGKNLVFIVAVPHMMANIQFWGTVPQMMVIFWVYELHTKHSFSSISKECTVSTFRVNELV
jgi:hypothetical protein